MSKPIDFTLPANQFDFQNYFKGRWYEQLRTQNRFQQGCECSWAEYTIEGSRVKIDNQCMLKTGKKRGGPPMGARKRLLQRKKASYRVTVAGFPSGVYNVLKAENVNDPEKGLAVIAGNSWKTVWVLTRKKDVESKVVKAAIAPYYKYIDRSLIEGTC